MWLPGFSVASCRVVSAVWARHQLELAELERSRPLGDECCNDRLLVGAAAEDSRRRPAEVGVAPLPQSGKCNVELTALLRQVVLVALGPLAVSNPFEDA